MTSPWVLLLPGFAPPKSLIHTFCSFTTASCPSSCHIVLLCCLNSHIRLWFQTLSFLLVFSPFLAFSFLLSIDPWSIISITFLPISWALPCFSFCYIQPWSDVPAFSALIECWVLLGTTTVLQVGATAYSLVSNLSWALTAAPHPLCCGSLLPPILRLAVSELLHTSPDTHSIPLPSLSPAALTAWKRSHCTGSPPFPSTISSNLPLAHLSLPPVLLSHWNWGPSCSQTNLTPVPSYSWGISSPSVIPSLESSAFFFIGFALST